MTLYAALPPLLGGALIGLASAMMMTLLGRVAGCSGILGGLLEPRAGEMGWRGAFIGGLLAGAALLALALPETLGALPNRSTGAVLLAGGLVGFGTRLGNGCTSGHGVCGIPRGSVRSLAATVTFIGVGMVTVTLVRVLAGGRL